MITVFNNGKWIKMSFIYVRTRNWVISVISFCLADSTRFTLKKPSKKVKRAVEIAFILEKSTIL